MWLFIYLFFLSLFDAWNNPAPLGVAWFRALNITWTWGIGEIRLILNGKVPILNNNNNNNIYTNSTFNVPLCFRARSAVWTLGGKVKTTFDQHSIFLRSYFAGTAHIGVKDLRYL